MQVRTGKQHRHCAIMGVGLCLAAAIAISRWCAVPAGCRQAELAWVPDDTRLQPVQAAAQQPGQKRVFLTFDDGPSPTTELVLDVLKEQQVPATFFVIAAPNNEKYLPILRRTVAEGHEIALHSCTHEYSEIYKSPAAYWADLRRLREKLEPYVPDADKIQWIRFPGGSTNTVSHKYGGSSIMKSLKAQTEEKGLHYVDWNVCAEDAVGGHPGAQQILHNVVSEADGKSTCVVLMHDTKATKTTAEALPQIIDWFRQNGFVFCRISALEPGQP